MTGESVPVEVGPGDTVVGGVINTHGRLVVGATRVGADTQLAQLARMVEAAQSGKADVQRLADRISGVFVPIVIALAVATLGFWLGQGADTSFAFTAAVAVLIIACPCALGLATPTALLVGTGRGAQLGIVIKGPEVLEAAQRLDTVVLDKTGTVTAGKLAVVGVIAGAGVTEAELVRRAGAAESGSEHPIARAIADFARTPARCRGSPAWTTVPASACSPSSAMTVGGGGAGGVAWSRRACRSVTSCGRRTRPSRSRGVRRCWSAGTGRPAGVHRGGRHPQADLGRGRPGVPRARPATRPAHRRPSRGGVRGRPARWASTR